MDMPSDYPRPDFDRSHRWLSLNGVWDFATDPDDRGYADGWEQPGRGLWAERITVPFAWETPRSGIAREWLPVGWYRRRIQRPREWANERIILHIGAAHYACQVWVNGRWIGEHIGGYLPFSFDITDALQDGAGEVVLRVESPQDKRSIPHGKQRSQPPDDYNDCAFSASSGVWQPVWLEGRPATYIENVQLRPTDDLTGIDARITLAGPHRAGATLTLAVEGDDAWTRPVGDDGIVTVILPLRQPRLWAPRAPHLYHMLICLNSLDGTDRVRSYTGLRTIETQGNRLLLNGERLYVRGVLDQGYWPESGYTAPDGAAIRRDVELTLAAGYNLARKHIKLEDPRWLYWADRLGLLVWAEPPCVGRYSPEAIARFEAQLAPMVARDGNHPSIVLWGIYNEEWGLDWRCAEDAEKQEAVERGYDMLAAADGSRPIIDNSGWSHVKTDILDWHYYDNDIRRWNDMTAAIVKDARTWFGHRLAVDRWYETQLSVAGRDHTSLPLLNGEYGGGTTDQERGWHLRWQTQELRRYDAISGYIYCELYDVEHELCGIYTADRQRKGLGCDPALINAETVIIIDVVPQEPSRDLVISDHIVSVAVRLSHHGHHPLSGALVWNWEDTTAPLGRIPVTLDPFEISEPLAIQCPFPERVARGRLILHVVDEADQCRAAAFLDVVTSRTDPRDRHADPNDNGMDTEEEQAHTC